MSLILNVIKDKLRGGIFSLSENENKEQVKVRELVKQEKGIDIIPDISEPEDDIIFEL